MPEELLNEAKKEIEKENKERIIKEVKRRLHDIYAAEAGLDKLKDDFEKWKEEGFALKLYTTGDSNCYTISAKDLGITWI